MPKPVTTTAATGAATTAQPVGTAPTTTAATGAATTAQPVGTAATTATTATTGAAATTTGTTTTTATTATTGTTTATTGTEETKKEEETKYVNGVDVKKLKANAAKIKADTGYDVSVNEETGKITVTPNGSTYDANAIQDALKPYVEKNKQTEISINKKQDVNLDKLSTNSNANTTKKNIKLAKMKEQLLHKIPDFDDFQKIHTKALIDRLEGVDPSNKIFDDLASSLKLNSNDKEDILQYMRDNIGTKEVGMALAELNYSHKNLFNNEKQCLENELKRRGITRKELGKLSDEEIADTKSLGKIQQTINQSEQQIKQEMKEIKRKVREGLFGWIRDFFGLYGAKYEQQENLLQQMKEQKNHVQSNIVESAKHANRIFAKKNQSRQTSSNFIDNNQDALVASQNAKLSTNINLLGIGDTDTGYAPSSGTESIEKQSTDTLQIG